MKKNNGFTLIELLVVFSIIAITAAITAPAIFDVLMPENRFKTNLSKLYSDIVFAQNEAVRQGGYNIMGGTLRERKVFLTFTGTNSYSIWRWEDLDGDNIVEAGEFAPDMAGGADAPVKTVTMGNPSQISYGIPGFVNKSACGNGALNPLPVTYSSTALPVCGNCPNIEFDANGFTDSSGVIYLTNASNRFAYAISGNRAGVFTMCKWNTASNQWQWIAMH